MIFPASYYKRSRRPLKQRLPGLIICRVAVGYPLCCGVWVEERRLDVGPYYDHATVPRYVSMRYL